MNSTSEEEVSKSSKSEAPLVDNSDNDEVFQNNVQVTTLLPKPINMIPTPPPPSDNWISNDYTDINKE